MTWETDELKPICSYCQARVKRVLIKWKNGHGVSRRFFCDTCGQWEDRKYLYKGELTTRIIHHGAKVGDF